MRNASTDSDMLRAYDDVERLHEAIWKKRYAEDFATIEQTQNSNSEAIRRAKSEFEKYSRYVRELEIDLSETPRRVDKLELVPEKPWTLISLCVLTVLCLVLIYLIYISYTVIAGYLINLGRREFLPPNEWKAYIVSGLPLAIPFVIELGMFFLRRKKRIEILIWSTIVAAVLTLTWLVLTFSTGTADLDPYGNSIGTQSSGLTSAIQVLAEIAASFVILTGMVLIVERHSGGQVESVGSKENEVYSEKEAVLGKAKETMQLAIEELEVAQTKEMDIKKDVSGLEKYLAAGEIEFCARASAFARESAARAANERKYKEDLEG